MNAYYDQGKERDRLAGPKGALEFQRTKEILQQRLPSAPAIVADIGGGPAATPTGWPSWDTRSSTAT